MCLVAAPQTFKSPTSELFRKRCVTETDFFFFASEWVKECVTIVLISYLIIVMVTFSLDSWIDFGHLYFIRKLVISFNIITLVNVLKNIVFF